MWCAGTPLPGLPCPSSSPTGSRLTALTPFARVAPWNTRVVREVLVVSAVVSLMGVVVWIGLLLWAAREDGRDQRERDRRLPRGP